MFLSASILFSGASPTKVLRLLKFLSIPTITIRTFFRHQRQLLMPAVLAVWRRERITLIGQAQKRHVPLVLGCDGRSDSPGHSAKFGSCTMIDMHQNKVIELQLVQVSIYM